MYNEVIIHLITYSSIILFSFSLLPWVIYIGTTKGKISFLQWLKRNQISPIEGIFSIVCLLTIMCFNAIHMIIPLIITFYTIHASRHLWINKSTVIKHKTDFLPAFIVIFLAYIGIHISYLSFGVWETANVINEYRLLQFPIILTVSFGYLFKIRPRDFNWSLSYKNLLAVFIIFVLVKLSYVVVFDFDTLQGLSVSYFLRNFLQRIYYPSFVEEVIFRGFLLGGLLSIGIRQDKANIMQSIVFGLVHILRPVPITIIMVCSTSMQIYLGYLIGKVYLSTKSLTPCIILHALIDTI